MHEVTIRSRSDGVTEVAPKLTTLDAEERSLVIFTVLINGGAFFVSGALPAAALGALAAACLAGEVVLGAKALFLALRRPLADVHEVPAWTLRRRSR
jgi:hypothetical protein